MRSTNRPVVPTPVATSLAQGSGGSLSATSGGDLMLTFPDNRFASALFGQYDQNLAKMERSLGVVAHAIGNQVSIKGSPEACERARLVLQSLYERIKLGQPITLGDVDGAIQEGTLQGILFPSGAGCRGRQAAFRADRDAQARPGARPQRRPKHLSARPEAERTGLRRRSGGHRQDMARGRLRRLAARAGHHRTADPVAPGRGGGRAARLPARRHARQGRSRICGRSSMR